MKKSDLCPFSDSLRSFKLNKSAKRLSNSKTSLIKRQKSDTNESSYGFDLTSFLPCNASLTENSTGCIPKLN